MKKAYEGSQCPVCRQDVQAKPEFVLAIPNRDAASIPLTIENLKQEPDILKQESMLEVGDSGIALKDEPILAVSEERHIKADEGDQTAVSEGMRVEEEPAFPQIHLEKPHLLPSSSSSKPDPQVARRVHHRASIAILDKPSPKTSRSQNPTTQFPFDMFNLSFRPRFPSIPPTLQQVVDNSGTRKIVPMNVTALLRLEASPNPVDMVIVLDATMGHDSLAIFKNALEVWIQNADSKTGRVAIVVVDPSNAVSPVMELFAFTPANLAAKHTNKWRGIAAAPPISFDLVLYGVTLGLDLAVKMAGTGGDAAIMVITSKEVASIIERSRNDPTQPELHEVVNVAVLMRTPILIWMPESTYTPPSSSSTPSHNTPKLDCLNVKFHSQPTSPPRFSLHQTIHNLQLSRPSYIQHNPTILSKPNPQTLTITLQIPHASKRFASLKSVTCPVAKSITLIPSPSPSSKGRIRMRTYDATLTVPVQTTIDILVGMDLFRDADPSFAGHVDLVTARVGVHSAPVPHKRGHARTRSQSLDQIILLRPSQTSQPSTPSPYTPTATLTLPTTPTAAPPDAAVSVAQIHHLASESIREAVGMLPSANAIVHLDERRVWVMEAIDAVRKMEGGVGDAVWGGVVRDLDKVDLWIRERVVGNVFVMR
ncbi:hypothetical protein HDU97_001499 [Phlyctochytrium planicorne]|nr:hypothetical protein HDU97_001499 [Phlyctochytrium planicorne]